MIKPQSQLTSHSCVAACISMISGVDQQIIIDSMRADSGGNSLWFEFRQWVRLGYLPMLKPWTDLEPGKLLLVTVPSLNTTRGNHRVIIDLRDEHTLYDPSAGRPGTKAYTLETLHSWSEVTEVVSCHLPNVLEKAMHARKNIKPYAMSDTGSQVGHNLAQSVSN